MFVIKKSQFDVFASERVKAFSRKLRQFLADQFPEHVRRMGGESLDSFISLVLERAKLYGFSTERELQIFAVYMILLGVFFDDDPQYPWAKDRLSRPGLSPRQRIDLFRSRAESAVVELTRENGSSVQRLFDQFLKLDPPRIVLAASSGSYPSLIAWHTVLFPEKAAWMRMCDKEALAGRAQSLAAMAGLAGVGERLIVVAMGMLGAGFADDPQFPALGKALRANLPADEKTLEFAKAGHTLAIDWAARLEGNA
ncbi:MAG: hypothetical protein DM484_12800 [Candidatus Methylumidiphilus alinenensis]|uniref:Uncharacterized protein n=1 Tax=Candidatus Methylumidiphilus alinenensis TaxID=2202197 RepID=A0A2W4R4Y8_9GAMM|nr:MAG: hypothetical protein DM484_12800 [Candidatus Methylumidiphilus alinenensis]